MSNYEKKAAWCDFPVSQNSVNETETFTVTVNGALVYTGTSYGDPNGNGTYYHCINARDIIADYIKAKVPNTILRRLNGLNYSTGTPEANGYEVEVAVVLAGVSVTKSVVPDWSYEHFSVSGTNNGKPKADAEGVIHDPVDSLMDWRQYLIFTAGTKPLKITATDPNGNIDVTNLSAGYTLLSKPGELFDGILVIDPTKRYTVTAANSDNSHPVSGEIKSTGARYVLHYVNEYGGWDHLLIQGKAIEKTSTERLEMEKTRWNSTIGKDDADLRRVVTPSDAYVATRGRTNYQNETTRKWELNTHWLTDTQSEKMRHIFHSAEVYLFDIEKQLFFPVIVKDSEYTIQKHRTNGRKLITYSLNVEAAYTEERR